MEHCFINSDSESQFRILQKKKHALKLRDNGDLIEMDES